MFRKNFKKVSILALIFFLLTNSASFADIEITRLSGANRYDTAVKVNDVFIDYSSSNYAVMSNGSDFKSSLYASYMASALKAPFYINGKHGITTEVLNKLKEKRVQKVFIVGNYDLLDKSIDNTLISKGIKFIRLYDKDAIDYYYGTNYVDKLSQQVDNVLFEYFHSGEPRGDVSMLILINENKFPDMLSAIPFAARLMIYEKTGLTDYRGFDANNGFKFIIGGNNSVPAYMKTYMGTDAPGLNDRPWTDDNTGMLVHSYSGRIAGSNRYKTAVEIAKSYKPVLGNDVDTAVIVNGEDFPDALTSGIAAVSTNAPILLTEPNNLNQDTKQFLKDSNIDNVVIVGGEKSVSKSVENEIRNLK